MTHFSSKIVKLRLSILAVLFACGGMAGILGPAQAGEQTLAAGCYQYSWGGRCSGSFRGFRNSSDPDARIQFVSGDLNGWMFAYKNGESYACYVNPTRFPSVAERWDQIMTSQSYFDIRWTDDGSCSYLYISNDSSQAYY